MKSLNMTHKHQLVLPIMAFVTSIMLAGCNQLATPVSSVSFEMTKTTQPIVSSVVTTPSSLVTRQNIPKETTSALTTPMPCDFMTADFTGKDAIILEDLLECWGFQYYKPDGIWSDDNSYELSIFQRWAGLDPNGTCTYETRKALMTAFLSYTKTTIPRNKLPLEGRYIGINAGHQQKADYGLEPLSPEAGSPKKSKVSSGTQGTYTRIPEYEVTLQVALKLSDQLRANGARVLIVRTTSNVTISNVERCILMNNAGVDVYISLHCNGSNDHNDHGIFTLVPEERGYQTGHVLTNSQKLANYMQTEEIKATGAANKGFSTRKDLSSFNWSKMPTCLIEMGFMTYKAEDKLLITSDYQSKLAKGIVEGFIQYFKDIG